MGEPTSTPDPSPDELGEVVIERVALSASPEGQQIAAAPTWSPNGQTLVYESSYRPYPGNPKLKYWWVSELFRVNVDGSAKRRLTDGAQPAWSPDGKQILFVGRRNSNADLWIMNADGTGQRRLTATPGYGEHTFAWSPGRAK